MDMRKMNTFGIHFVIRVTKQQKNEMGAVFARISVNGRKSEISLKAKVLPKNWDEVKGKAKGKREDVIKLNKHIERVRSLITDCYHQLIQQRQTIAVDAVKSLYLGEDKKEGMTLIKLSEYHKQGVPEELLMNQYEPFKTTFIKQNNRSTNYMYFLWPGILATVLQQVLLLGLALSFASEFENGTFAELSRQTKSVWEMIAVKVIPYLIMSFGIWILYYLFTLWFRIPFHENIGTLTLIAGVFVLAVSFIGILVSIMIPNQLKATEVLMVIATPSFILSGFTWPLSQMPVWIQWIAQVIPLTHFLPAFRILIVENGSVTLTYPYIFNMLLIAFIGLILSGVLLYFKRKNVLKEEI